MKRQILILGAVVCLLIPGLAFAQKWTQQATVSVPFEFAVGATVLPAGTYTVSTPAGVSGSLLKLTNTVTGASAFASNIDITVKPHPYNQTSSLVFVLEPEGRRVLHQVWITGDSHGHNLMHEKGLTEPR